MRCAAHLSESHPRVSVKAGEDAECLKLSHQVAVHVGRALDSLLVQTHPPSPIAGNSCNQSQVQQLQSARGVGQLHKGHGSAQQQASATCSSAESQHMATARAHCTDIWTTHSQRDRNKVSAREDQGDKSRVAWRGMAWRGVACS